MAKKKQSNFEGRDSARTAVREFGGALQAEMEKRRKGEKNERNSWPKPGPVTTLQVLTASKSRGGKVVKNRRRTWENNEEGTLRFRGGAKKSPSVSRGFAPGETRVNKYTV